MTFRDDFRGDFSSPQLTPLFERKAQIQNLVSMYQGKVKYPQQRFPMV